MSVLSYRSAMSELPAIIQAETEGLSRVCIAIDGMSGAGKSHFARELAEKLGDAAIISTDLFYLPIAERTSERTAQPGWNIDYERFTREVARPVLRGEELAYGVFDCHTQSIVRRESVRAARYLIVEGCYAMHPEIPDFYDFRITVRADEKTRLDRIRARDGENMLHRFLTEWLPLEEAYLTAYMVEELSDAVVDTGGIENERDLAGFSGFSMPFDLN